MNFNAEQAAGLIETLKTYGAQSIRVDSGQEHGFAGATRVVVFDPFGAFPFAVGIDADGKRFPVLLDEVVSEWEEFCDNCAAPVVIGSCCSECGAYR